MGVSLAISRERGEILAKFNWVKCADPDERSERSKEVKREVRNVTKRLNLINTLLFDLLSHEDMKSFMDECERETHTFMDLGEKRIEREFRPCYATYNEKSLKLMTTKQIPEDVCLGLSFGWKFLFPYTTTNDNIHSVLAQLEDCIEQTVPVMYLRRTYNKVANIVKNRSSVQHNDDIQWLCFVSRRIYNFFDENKDIFATKSDKGGHTVVIDLLTYEEEITKMLNCAVYKQIQVNPLDSLVDTECKLIKYLSSNEKTKSHEEMKRFRQGFQPKLLQLAKFYGLPKVHKENFCLRPIMSLVSAPSFATGKIFDIMLKTIFPRSDLHIRDSLALKEYIDGIVLDERDILVSFDVVSMFTSIPRYLVKQFVMEKHQSFCQLFGMGKKILEKFLEFLLVDSTVFSAVGNVYQQCEGLPMGSCISPTLARITMDRVVHHLTQRVPEITFIRVFVDDTITAIHEDSVGKALQALNEFNDSIKFTCEIESDSGSINFLNMTLTREKQSIIVDWFRKYFASGRLLNYLSSHKRSTISETAINFICTIRNLSDGRFFHANKQRIIDTLRDNSFPETVIISLMNEHYTLMKVRNLPEKQGDKYFVYPHAVCESKKIKKILHKNKNDCVVYAESTKNTKINYVKTRKTVIPKRLRGNSVVSSTCVCKRKHKVISTRFNQTAEMAINTIKTSSLRCTKHYHAFRKFKIHKGLAYGSQTDSLAKYIQWKFRGSYLNTKTGRPEYCFGKLMDESGRNRKH